jgi:hypothetical protein
MPDPPPENVFAKGVALLHASSRAGWPSGITPPQTRAPEEKAVMTSLEAYPCHDHCNTVHERHELIGYQHRWIVQAGDNAIPFRH